MAKKKSTKRVAARRKSVKASAPQHELPAGYWQQAAAVLLMACAVLIVVSWFGAGGPVLDWLQYMLQDMIGWAVYVVPIVAVFIAVETFRAEDNRLPFSVKFTSLLAVVWCSGMCGLLMAKQGNHPSGGGLLGDSMNSLMLSLVSAPVGIFIYILLLVFTMTFIFQLSFDNVLQFFKTAVMSSREKVENEANVEIMRKAAKPKAMSEFKLNEGVPTMTEADKKKSKLAALHAREKKDEPEEKAAMLAVSDPNWQFPSLDLLEKSQSPADVGDIKQNAGIIQDTLHEFNIDVEMEGANIGPKVTQYMLRPPAGIKLNRITALETNIALNLAASSLRMEAPIPGKKAVGIEVPNKKAADVRLYGILNSSEWRKSKAPLSIAIGKDISGQPFVGELNKMPHLLVAGQTGSGKSVMINTLLCSLLYRNAPSDLKLILVDPKQVEMAPYQDIPHLLTPVIVEPEKTVSALKWAVNEMERRYTLLADERVRDIKTYNQKVEAKGKKIGVQDEDGNVQQVDGGKMPYIVIVIDEMADLMMIAKRDVEALIVRIAQKARAVGIHLVLATQRPSVDVITGLIKANVPARIAFTVASQTDSITILDQAGAEKLLGQGDMLMKTASMPKPKRIQGAWVMDNEVNKITDHLRMQSAPQYNNEIISQPVQLNGKGGVVMDFGNEGGDDMFRDAVNVVVQMRKASTSLLQRKLRIGYSRAARIIEEMEEQGIIGPADGSRPREVLISSVDELDNGA